METKGVTKSLGWGGGGGVAQNTSLSKADQCNVAS